MFSLYESKQEDPDEKGETRYRDKNTNLALGPCAPLRSLMRPRQDSGLPAQCGLPCLPVLPSAKGTRLQHRPHPGPAPLAAGLPGLRIAQLLSKQMAWANFSRAVLSQGPGWAFRI